jgi:hypothetical protein
VDENAPEPDPQRNDVLRETGEDSLAVALSEVERSLTETEAKEMNALGFEGPWVSSQNLLDEMVALVEHRRGAYPS